MIRILVCEDYAEISRCAADVVAAQLSGKPDSVLGFATGSTPEGMYAELARDCREGRISFARACTFNLDEYYPISPDAPCSYRRYMEENLFSRIDIDPANTHLPNGLAEDPEAEGKHGFVRGLSERGNAGQKPCGRSQKGQALWRNHSGGREH